MIPAEFVPQASHLWQSTLFAAVAGLLTLALRRNQARVRYWLWLAASYKFLIPFSWLVSIGHQFQWRAAPAIMPHTFSVVTDAVSQTLLLTTLPVAKPTPDHLAMLLIVIWAVWACGFVAVAARWAREWLHIRAMVRSASPILLDLPIRVVSTPARLEPGVFGVFRPVLLLPEGIAVRLTPAQLQAVLAHELCHVRRRDNLTAAVHMLVEALFWFHPLVWWLGARLIDERERACDEEVLQLGGEREAYAEGILNVCKSYIESPVACVSGISGSDLKKRIGRIMTYSLGDNLTFRRKLLLTVIGIAAIAGPLVFGVLAVPASQSSALPQWQTEAGGKMAFDFASVKQNKSDAEPYSNIPLGPGDLYTPTGGLFSATNFPLMRFITFAYKMQGDQYQSLRAQLPRWAVSNNFDIQARAQGNAAKDQIRLMLQSLLAERFKLAVHYESHQFPVYGLVLVNPGKTGPQLQPHPTGLPCSTDRPMVAGPGTAPAASPPIAGGFPTACGGQVFMDPSVPGRSRIGARNVGMAIISGNATLMGNLNRPVLDRTGLSGNFDFFIEWVPEPNGTTSAGANSQADPTGPSLTEALREQLGLKLESQTGPINVLVIDHIEEPSPN